MSGTFGELLRHEAKLLRADRAVWLVVFIAFAVAGFGVHNGLRWVDFQRATIAQAQAEERERLAETRGKIAALEASGEAFDANYFRDPRNPRSFNSVTGYRWATLAPAYLAPLAIGQSDLFPYYTTVTISSRHASMQFEELQNPLQLLAGRFDLAFVVVYLLPLLVFALSYNMIAEERETGTLSLLLAQPVSLRSLLTAKLLVRGGVVTLLCLGVSLGGLWFAAQAGFPALGPLGIAWTFTVLAYGLFWLALAVVLNSFRLPSSTSALVLAAVWLVWVAIVPALLNAAIAAVHPLPSRIALVEASRTAQNVSQERVAKVTTLDMDARARSSLLQILDAEKELAPLLRQFDEQLELQRQMVNGLRFLSPSILAQQTLTDLAGTSGTRHRQFATAVEEFRGQWRNYIGERMARSLTPADVDAAPVFRFPEANQHNALPADALGLLGSALALGALGLWRIQKQKII